MMRGYQIYKADIWLLVRNLEKMTNSLLVAVPLGIATC